MFERTGPTVVRLLALRFQAFPFVRWSIRALAEVCEHGQLTMPVNNAGVIVAERLKWTRICSADVRTKSIIGGAIGPKISPLEIEAGARSCVLVQVFPGSKTSHFEPFDILCLVTAARSHFRA
jgi:hypothetical protein